MSDPAQATCERNQLSAGVRAKDHTALATFADVQTLTQVIQINTAAPAYSVTARMLHWVTAFMILLMIPLGLIIGEDWGGPLQDSLYGLHEALGALLFPLVLGWLGYRLINPPLRLPNDIPAPQRLAAHATHVGLYALLIVQPLIGWVALSAYGSSINLMGMLELPRIVPKDRSWSEQLFDLHGLIGFAITGLVAVHIAAALYHHVVRKDRVLMRMISG